MRFVTPQFINIEPKIIGPITARQFIILVAGGGLIFITYKLFSLTVFIFITVFVLGPAILAFAFFKVNGRPFHFFLLSFVQNARMPTLRIWKKEEIIVKEVEIKEKEKITGPVLIRKPLPTSKLSYLSLQVDTGGKFFEESEKTTPQAIEKN
jgi:hypothetical protein